MTDVDRAAWRALVALVMHTPPYGAGELAREGEAIRGRLAAEHGEAGDRACLFGALVMLRVFEAVWPETWAEVHAESA